MSNFQTLNSGEWSEVYALFKAISDKKLRGCNHNLDLIDNEFCSVISVEKKQQTTECDLSYRINKENVEIYKDNVKQKEISLETFRSMADYLLKEIKSNHERTFDIPVVKNFLHELLNPKIKAPKDEKNDIIITVEEPITKTNQKYGFSVKSNFKASSTLFNASQATNFTYIVRGKINDYESRAKELLKKVKSISFSHIDSKEFSKNLERIDTQFDKIISLILLYYYQGKARRIKDLVELVEKVNPLGAANTDIYKIKVKEFLLSVAFGMVASKEWNGKYSVDGGIIVIKENGDIVSFYIFKQELLEELKEYLWQKTYLDTPSTSRHKFGRLYEVNYGGKKTKELKLNLQIRIYSN